MISMAQARDHIGDGVVYYPDPGIPSERAEQGVITSVNDAWVFVRYGDNTGSKATSPANLVLLNAAER